MSEKPDGGKAFPSLDVYEGYDRDRDDYRVMSDVETGMSLRDYFAGQALTGLLSESQTVASVDQVVKDKDIRASEVMASTAYVIADAMIAEREK